jgi:hypothetical protein
MARWSKVLVTLAMAAALAVSVTVPPAAADDAPRNLSVTVLRDPFGIRLGACLPEVTPRLEAQGLTATGTASTSVNGRLLVWSRDAVSWSIPPLGEDPPACANGVHFHQDLTLAQLASVGIEPASGTWETFDVEVQIEIDGAPLSYLARRQVTIGAGPPIGAITSVESTSGGALVRGWVVHPSLGPVQHLDVTVNGRRWTPAPTYPLPQYNGGVFTTNRPTSNAEWVDRGLGPFQDFELLTPPGEICVSAPDLRLASAPSVLIGCRASSTNGDATASFSAIETIPTPGTWGSTVRVRGVVTDPWADPGELPRLTLVAGTQRWPVTATPAADLRGPLSDGSGVFRFDHTFNAVAPGTVRFCVVASYGNEPVWWLGFINAQPLLERQLSCTDAAVPDQAHRPPIGALDRIDVAGRTVTAQGWALDPNGGSPRVLLAANGFPAALGRSQLSRPDVRAAVGGDGTAGYALSAQLGAGTHDVCVLWEDTTTTGQWSSPTCQQVVVK